MIVFISCTKKKINKRCKVKELYTASAWFRKAYKYAVSLNPIYIYIYYRRNTDCLTKMIL